jgi:nucleotide-binding universal stress UspA family protein
MKNTTTLLLINRETSDAVIHDLAESAAQEQTHLSCLMIGPAPQVPTYAYGMSPYGGMSIPDNWGENAENAQQEMVERVTEINALFARSNVSAALQSVLCTTMEIKDIVARRARVCDIAHIAANLRDTPAVMREMAHGILFKSPVGLMLNASPSQKPGCVFVAWNGSQAASKAVHVALPYLQVAEKVIVACFDPETTTDRNEADPGTDLAAWLSHHGCAVTVSQFPTGGREVAQCIQDRAREQGADLIVMGAYGHARMIEAVFGGTTRTIIEQADMPVLLAH